MTFSLTPIPETVGPAAREHGQPTGVSDSDHPAETVRLEQYEIVWVLPAQYTLQNRPDGFGLEIVDFLGPGGFDHRGQRTVWVRGPVIHAASTAHGVRLVRGEPVTVAIPHDQPRAARTGGQVHRPPVPDEYTDGGRKAREREQSDRTTRRSRCR
jgi:hypothetical protein